MRKDHEHHRCHDHGDEGRWGKGPQHPHHCHGGHEEHECCGGHGGPRRHDGECCRGGEGRGMGPGAPFRRHFPTREEQIAWLEEYLKELQAEAKGVEERIAELKAGE